VPAGTLFITIPLLSRVESQITLAVRRSKAFTVTEPPIRHHQPVMLVLSIGDNGGTTQTNSEFE
jgi:hypothetical protein